MKNFVKVIIASVVLLCGAVTISAQTKNTTSKTDRKISGIVVDSENGETLPFSNVYVRQTLIGVQTDFDGAFSISVPAKYDTLWIGAMGYRDQFLLTREAVKKDSLVVRLIPENIAIEEITVTPDDAPHRLLKAVIANKDKNNPENHKRTEFEKYTRWDYSVDHISDRAQNNWFFRDAQSLMQISEDDSSRFLPVYFSETLSKNETQKEPTKLRSTILADRTKGIDIFKQYEIGGFSSAMDDEVNFYDDVVKLYGVGFVSPFAKNCFHYYDFFIIDSAMVAGPASIPDADSTKIYTVKFRPKNVGDKVFMGTMDIETRQFSPVRVDAEMPKGTNINFVKKLKLHSTYQMVDDTIPFYGVNQMEASVDYMPVESEKTRLSIKVNMYNSQSNVRVDMPEPLVLSKNALSIETVKMEGYKEMGDEFWEERRHEELTAQEQRTTEVIDSINNVGTVKAVNYLAKAGMTGYLDVGVWEIGSIGEMFNTNKIESLHLGFGARTSKEISENWVFSGILGYGFKNSRVTYGAGVGYKFPGPIRRTIDFKYEDRLMKIGEDENILYLYENMLSTSETNIIAQLFKRKEIDELLYVQKFRLRYDNEWLTGFSTRLQCTALRQESPKYYPFTQGGEEIEHVYQQEVSLDFRISFREKFIDEGLQRMYMGTEYPIMHFVVAGGHTKAGEKESNYMRLHSTFKHRFYLGTTKLDLALENGMYFGKLPYSVLNIARGNKTYGYYRYDFNLMDYLEFVCDRYVYVYCDYFLDGLLLHKLPAIHKLGVREVVGCKLMFGSLSEKHEEMLDLPDGVGGPTKPYAEVSVGLDNILRFFRLDFVYRAVGDDFGDAPKCGGRLQFNVKF